MNCCDWHRDGGSTKLKCGPWDVMSQSYMPTTSKGVTITITPGKGKTEAAKFFKARKATR